MKGRHFDQKDVLLGDKHMKIICTKEEYAVNRFRTEYRGGRFWEGV